MKKFNSRIYLYIAVAGLIGIIALMAYFLFTPLQKTQEVQYIYIDADDTQDSVFAKLAPIANQGAMAGFMTLIRHVNAPPNSANTSPITNCWSSRKSI